MKQPRTSERKLLCIYRSEADFDRACDSAVRQAHLTIPDADLWDKHCVAFVGVQFAAEPVSREWCYTFEVWGEYPRYQQEDVQ